MEFESNNRDAIASKAWKRASKDLGFKFISPFRFTTRDGKVHVFVGLVHEFGKPKGGVIGFIGQEDAVLTKELEAAGYSWSFFASPPDAGCEVNFFKEILDDWGWHGSSEDRPPWYTGKPWS